MTAFLVLIKMDGFKQLFIYNNNQLFANTYIEIK